MEFTSEDSIVIGFTIALAVLPVVFLCMLSEIFDHGPLVTGMLVVLACMAGLIALGIVLCYYVVLEGRYGKTVGKHVLGLAVRRTNGEPIGYREALIRNIPKYIRNFLIIDALIMLIFFNQEKQRAFDKAADTIVVHMG